MAVQFYKPDNQVPLKMHKVCMMQKISLLPVEERLKRIQEAGANLIGGLEWVEEPEVLLFFGRMKEIGYWQEELAEKFKKDFGESL